MPKLFLDPATLTLSRPQSAGELTVLPLLRPGTAEPGYLTLGEALARGLTRVTEVSEGGSVPHLLFINDAMRPVLLLDGEELVGAKLFDSPRTFTQLLPKLVRSYGLDALDHSLPRDSAPAAVGRESCRRASRLTTRLRNRYT